MILGLTKTTPATNPGLKWTSKRDQTDSEADDVVTSLPGDERKGLKRIVTTYANGEVCEHEGTILNASEMARSWGLTVVPTSDDTVRWTRDTSTFTNA